MNPYIGLYPNQFAIGHHSTTAAQHATGTPLYSYGYPYHPGLIYPTAVMPVDYVLDEKSDDGMSVSLSNTILTFILIYHFDFILIHPYIFFLDAARANVGVPSGTS